MNQPPDKHTQEYMKISEQRLEMLCLQWDIIPEEIYPARRGYRLRTRLGEKFLGIGTAEEVVFGWYLRQHAFKNGFTNMLRCIPNKYGDPYIISGNDAVFLTDWLNGNKWQLRGERDIAGLSALLGEFHLKTQGFSIKGAELPILVTPDEIIREALQMEPPPLNSQNVETFRRLFRRTEKVLAVLPREAIISLSRRSLKEKLVVHGGFCVGNIIDYASEAIIVDFSDAAYGLPVWDLIFFINNCLAVLGYDRELIRTAVIAYEDLRRLSREEREVFSVGIDLPLGFINALVKWSSHAIDSREFNTCLMQEEILLNRRVRPHNVSF